MPYRPGENFIKIVPGNKKRDEIVKRIIEEIREKIGADVDQDKVDRLIPQGKCKIEKLFINKKLIIT